MGGCEAGLELCALRLNSSLRIIYVTFHYIQSSYIPQRSSILPRESSSLRVFHFPPRLHVLKGLTFFIRWYKSFALIFESNICNRTSPYKHSHFWTQYSIFVKVQARINPFVYSSTFCPYKLNQHRCRTGQSKHALIACGLAMLIACARSCYSCASYVVCAW